MGKVDRYQSKTINDKPYETCAWLFGCILCRPVHRPVEHVTYNSACSMARELRSA